jgi:hypothetical protein
LVVAFIQQSGYLLPSTDPLSSMLLKGDKKNKISGQELNTALDLMQVIPFYFLLQIYILLEHCDVRLTII